MKKQDRKALKESLILAVKKQLLENNAEVAGKFEKSVKKSIKQIVKKARKRKAIVASKVILAPNVTKSGAVKVIKVSKPAKKTKKSKVS